MDPEQVRSAVTEKTKAIIAVDLAGIISVISGGENFISILFSFS